MYMCSPVSIFKCFNVSYRFVVQAVFAYLISWTPLESSWPGQQFIKKYSQCQAAETVPAELISIIRVLRSPEGHE